MKYMAKQLIKFDPAMKEAKEGLGNACYLKLVGGSDVELNPKFKTAIETVLKRRQDLKDGLAKYVAEKLTEFDPAMKKAKEELGAECFLEVVKGSVVTELDPEFKAAFETFLKRRFNLKDHKCVFLKTPTVEQWIADLTGLFSEEDVYAVFAQKSGLSEEIFKTKTYGDNVLNVPFVMDIVEMLESVTGKELTDAGYLKSKDSYAYANIAKFFATA